MNILSPIQRSQILANLIFPCNLISLHSPHSQLHTLQSESSGHQPVGHILFQFFINRPFDFAIFTLPSSSLHFLPLIVAAAAGWSTVIEFMKFEWRRQFVASFFFLRSLWIVCALIAINLYRYQPHLSAVGKLATMRRLVPIFFFTPFDSYSLFIEQYEMAKSNVGLWTPSKRAWRSRKKTKATMCA